MSSWVEAVPSFMKAAGTLGEGREARVQSKLLAEHSRVAGAQGARDEEAQRRAARFALGRQVAATGEAGGGYGGSAGLLLDQSAVMAELDALNIRYGGQMRSRGFKGESMALRERARGAGLLAGAQLLTGTSRAYTRQRLLDEEGL